MKYIFSFTKIQCPKNIDHQYIMLLKYMLLKELKINKPYVCHLYHQQMMYFLFFIIVLFFIIDDYCIF